MNNKTNSELLTKMEAAELLKVSGRTVDNWCYRGVLPYSKIGSSRNAIVCIRRADVETMLNSHRIGGS